MISTADYNLSVQLAKCKLYNISYRKKIYLKIDYEIYSNRVMDYRTDSKNTRFTFRKEDVL